MDNSPETVSYPANFSKILLRVRIHSNVIFSTLVLLVYPPLTYGTAT